MTPFARNETPRAAHGFSGADHVDPNVSLAHQGFLDGMAPLLDGRTPISSQATLREHRKLLRQGHRGVKRFALGNDPIRETDAERFAGICTDPEACPVFPGRFPAARGQPRSARRLQPRSARRLQPRYARR